MTQPTQQMIAAATAVSSTQDPETLVYRTYFAMSEAERDGYYVPPSFEMMAAGVSVCDQGPEAIWTAMDAARL